MRSPVPPDGSPSLGILAGLAISAALWIVLGVLCVAVGRLVGGW